MAAVSMHAPLARTAAGGDDRWSRRASLLVVGVFALLTVYF